ncbi:MULTISPECIES: helix-turn-helix domain-containing protein [unclassified Streptomyces]|uniref:helix-turn-helix domain-containing protein n=1 Tax=unclassified Streptomyces TaxID=2593676 RepID=UPI003321B182
MNQGLRERIIFADAPDDCSGPTEPGPTVILRSPGEVAEPETFSLGTLTCTAFSSGDPVEVESVRAQPRAGIAVGLVLAGETTVNQAGRSVALGPGQFTMYSGAQPFTISAPVAHSYLAIAVPLYSIGRQLVGLPEILASSELNRTTSGSILSAALTCLAGGHTDLTARARVEHGNAVLSLIHAVIMDHASGEPPSRKLSLFNQLAQWIEHHLRDEVLDAERLAAAHHLSTRYVRHVFAEQHSTVSRYVRQRRLERACADLTDPLQASLCVAAVARHWRFDNASVFSRAFKAQYGLGPQAYRQANSRL